MAKTKYPDPQKMRLSRETCDVLDSIARELDLRSRAAAISLLSKVARRNREATGSTWEELLLGKELVRDSESL